MMDLEPSPEGEAIAIGIPLEDEAGIGALTLSGYLREVAHRFGPAEAAVIHLDGRAERWTYASLLDRSLEVARALKSVGVGKGTRVGLLMTNRLEFLSGLFGIALAGGVAAAISTFFTAGELDEVLRASGCSVLLVEPNVLKKDFIEILAGLEPSLLEHRPGQLSSLRYPFLRHVIRVDANEGVGAVEGWRDFLQRGRDVLGEVVLAGASQVCPSDPALLFFSSGSTGKAKGILSSHKAVCLQLWRWRQWYRIETPPRTWSANGFFFSGNFTMALGGTLSSGGCLILQRYFDATEAIELFEREKASMLLAWPHQWPRLEAAPNYADADLSSLHYMDAAFPLARHPTVQAQWREPTNAYGSTEAFTLISVFPAGTPGDVAAGSHGVPTAGSTIRIVDPLSGATLKRGERGEIAVKGPTLMMGYLCIPLEETLDAQGFYRTGDGGYLDGKGRLFWEGRLNDIVKTGGANVSPLEIDAVIRECPGVKFSQTVGVPDVLLGEIVVSCVVAWPDQMISEELVQNCARQRLASFKVPRRVLFFGEDELQTTGSSKIKTAELRKIAGERLARAEMSPQQFPSSHEVISRTIESR